MPEARPSLATDDDTIAWLLEVDPAIRWQVMRDLLDEPQDVWEKERARTVTEGSAAEMLSRRDATGEWPAGRWTASTWTLLLLIALGVSEQHPAGRPAVERLLDRFLPPGEEVDGAFLLGRVDLCHLAFLLGLPTYFLDPDDPRLPPLADAILSAELLQSRRQAERPLAAADADPGHAARRDGEAGRRQPLEHPAGVAGAPASKRVTSVACASSATRRRASAARSRAARLLRSFGRTS